MQRASPHGRYDCLIVGGGPAGLTAAIYLARFHLTVLVVDSGKSRARSIPLTRNHAGFPEGIAGSELLARMEEQARSYGALVQRGKVETIEGDAESEFVAHGAGGPVRARTILNATGVVNRRPPLLDEDAHARALQRGQIRYCPICDGYEVTDRAVAVIGTGERGCNEALFLRSYTRQVTLVSPQRQHDLDAGQRARLADAGIAIAGPYTRISADETAIHLLLAGREVAFDSIYPALGSDVRSRLAGALGARLSGEGCVTVDRHQRTSVPGVYAAGDVVLGLDQISHAMGEGGVAATTIRNDLAEKSPLRR
ncbi:MAG: NAD(P)/FAD-dependent oxidoreductase [Sphingomonadales bacterium]|nr:NAD(P)/FAD-dependent oxidoreductase [Sphingomonadales bacterium]